jgi:hypothetical protein
MSSTTWTSTGSTNWYTGGNWSGGVPTVSTSGTELVVVSGADGTQPIISPLAVGAPGTFTVDVNGFVIKETQLDGQFITLTTGADLTLQGLALGNYRGTSGDTAPGGTISNLTDVNGTLASYDTHMLISATGSDKLVSNDINENFGQILAGAGDTLSISVTPGGNPQSIQAFLNYGLIEATSGGVITVGTAVAANGTTSVFANPGWIEAIGGTFDTTAFISDNANVPNGAGTPDGYIEIGGTGGTAELLGGAAPKEDVLFLGGGSNDQLVLANNNSFQGSISGFSTGDSILLTGASGTPTLSYAGSILTIGEVNGSGTVTQTVTLDVGSGHGVQNYQASTTGSGIIITEVPCFAAGTRILTPDGERLVQDLRAGDDVLVVRPHGDAVQKIIWTGSRTVNLARHARPEKVVPVRILAGALGAGLPERDLVLSPDHCLFIDGHLIEAKTLVNGATVIQDVFARTVTYHHIETERHEVVLAEGVPVETYLDAGNRQMFDGAAYHVLHADFAAASRENAVAELVLDGPVVHAARQRLLNRALALGFAPTASIDLTVKAGLEKLRPEADSLPEKLVFVLPRPVTEVALLSSIGVPAHVSASPADNRRLGVAIRAVTLVADGKRVAIALDDPAHVGFYDMEPAQRWTNGAARLALPAFAGRATLEIQTNGQAARWAAPRKPAVALA